MLSLVFGSFRSWVADERGQVAPLLGLALIPLLAGVGLILEGGLLLFQDRLAHNAADAGAYAGTRVLWQELDTSSPAVSGLCSAVQGTGRPAVDAACAAAMSRGYTADEVTVNMPPVISTAFAGAAGHIEVRVERVLGTSIMSLVGVPQVRPGGRAVGGGFPASPLYAIYALSRTACPGMDIASQGSLTVVGGVKVNAECRPPVASDRGTDKSGGGNVTIDGPFDIVGAYRQSGGGSVSPQPTEDTGVLPDPLGGLLSPVLCLQGAAGCGTSASATRLRWPLAVADERFAGHYDIQTGWECAPSGDPPPCDPLAGETLVPAIEHYGVHDNNNLLVVSGSHGSPQTYNACTGPDHDGDGRPELYPGVYFGGIETTGNGCNNGLQVKGGVYLVAGRSGPGRAVDFSKTLIPSFLSVDIPVVDPFGDYVRTISGVNGVFFYLTDAPCAGSRCRHGSFNLSTSGGQTAVLDAGPPPGPGECMPGQGSYRGILAWEDRANPGDYDTVAAPLCDRVDGACANEFFVQGGGLLTKLRGSLYDRYGRLQANGSYEFEDAQLIFNVVDLTIQGDTMVAAPDCVGGQPLVPRLRE